MVSKWSQEEEAAQTTRTDILTYSLMADRRALSLLKLLRYLGISLAYSNSQHLGFITLFGLFDLVVVFLLLSFVFLSVPLDFMILTRMLPHFSSSYQ